jgi:hypothetical protein
MEPVTPLRGVLAYHIGRKQSASIGHCATDQSLARALQRPLSDDALKIVMRRRTRRMERVAYRSEGKHK